MIRLSGYQVDVDIPIDIIGIRPGEKIDEELRRPEEEILTTYHPYINELIPITAPPDEFAQRLEDLEAATARRDAEAVRTLLFGSVSSALEPAPSGRSLVALSNGSNGYAPHGANGHAPDEANGSAAANGQPEDAVVADSAEEIPSMTAVPGTSG
jgi:hypothetical protein